MKPRNYIALARQYEDQVLDGTIPACKWVRLACERSRRDRQRARTKAFQYYFDRKEAAKRCRQAELFPHIKGPKAKVVGRDHENRPVWATIELEPHQCWFLSTLFGWKRVDNGLRRFRVALYLVPRKNAKALALDTVIPTPDGYKRMGELRIGDRVFGVDGHPARVVAESEVFVDRPCYEVEFSTGERVVADADHLWVTRARVDAPGVANRRGSRRGPSLERVRTTREIADTLHYGARGDRNHAVRVAESIDLPDATLPINPYALGVWLGDGSVGSGRFTKAATDAELLAAVASAEGGVTAGARRGGSAVYRVGPSYRAGVPAAETFQGRLRALGVLFEKHVPIAYLRASRAQRLALLQGLMDTDGSVSKAGQLTFVSTSHRLAEDALELVASLGFKPTMGSYQATIGGRVIGVAYRIQFWAGDAVPVFRLSRKRNRQRPRSATARSLTRQIVAVRPVASVPCKCIAVDSSDHTFLVGRTFVPTHNSTLAAIIALLMLADDGESGAEVYSAATTREQAKVIAEIAWEMASRSPQFRAYFGLKLGAKTSRTLSVPATAGKFGPLSADAHTLDALNISCALVDELHAHKTRAVWDVIDTATGARPQPLILATTTAGVDIGGICYQKLTYLQGVLEGVFEDEQFFGINYTIDEGDDWRDPVVLQKANPNYGVSVDPGDLARKVREAARSPAGVNNFLTKHCNVWVRAESTWMPMDEWRACGHPALRVLAALEALSA